MREPCTMPPPDAQLLEEALAVGPKVRRVLTRNTRLLPRGKLRKNISGEVAPASEAVRRDRPHERGACEWTPESPAQKKPVAQRLTM